MPFFSIILPTFNRAHFLPKAIESVLTQTFEDWELVIVDDGSTDTTKEVVLAYQDPRIVYIYQENQERSAARNHGISKARGEYICFLDSDDYFLDQKLEFLHRSINQKKTTLVFFYDDLYFEFNGKRSKNGSIEMDTNETKFEFLLKNPIFSQQVCCRSTLIKKHTYNVNLRIGEDVELWLRLATETEFEYIPSYQTVIVEHEDRSVNLKKFNAAKEQLKQLEMIFQQYDHQQISHKVRSEVLSNCYFNSAKHFMMNNMKGEAIKMIVKSLVKNPKNNQSMHRIYCLLLMIRGKIPFEYNML
jgi:glycosyltransferase involved in cell wall biosynthesis